ncbi:FAD-dependent monooxygenase, partial [Sanguibacter sp. 26GB23]|uniref:FAD-dependent monooxygenase n=1 Tax=Sanguibacter sp. 26GB23 TaxID=3156066 RepID=UPI0032AF751A
MQRHARHYVQPHFALVGDAAHSIHPLAGQGVNLGLMDAAVLAEEVVHAWQRGAPWGELSTLRRY